MALFFPQSVNLTGVDEPQRLVGSFATGSFFDVPGLKPERGRFFTDEESAPGTVKPVVVITHQTWQRLLASVGVVLLIACVNVSQLLLARAVDREQEIALRAALGASRAAVTRQLLVEAGLLAAAASGAGFALGRWALLGVNALKPASVSMWRGRS